MKIEFRYWPGNTEVSLIDCMNDSDDIEVEVDKFYTADTHFHFFAGRTETPLIADAAFASLEAQAVAPNVAGAWAEHHRAMRRYRERHGEK